MKSSTLGFKLKAAFGFAAVTFSTHVQALELQSENLANASAICTPALPAYEGLIRKRPLAVQNEGTQTAFVTCSFITASSFGRNTGTDGFAIWLKNRGTEPATISCTGVVGMNDIALYMPRTIVLAPGQLDRIRWVGVVEQGQPWDGSRAINASCALPPGTGMEDTYVWFKTYIPG